jgi:hypothetical protein
MAYTFKVMKGEKIVAEATTYAEAQAEAKRVGGHVLSPVSQRNPSSGAKQRARGTRDLAYLTDAPPAGIDRAMHAWDLERAAKTRKELAKIKKPSQRKMWLDSHKRSLKSAKSIRESGYLPINRQKLEDAVHDHVQGIKPLSIGSLVAGCTVTNIDTRSVTFRDPNYGTSQVLFSTLRKNPAKDANLSHALSFEAKLAKRNPAHQIGSESTQVATTTGSYRKAAEMLAHHGVTGKVIDYGAGLGLGSDAMRTVLQRVDSFEPEARRWQGGVPVTFTDSNQIPLGAYDGVVSLNVLNVLEPELRRYVAQSICDVTAPSGYALIGVRGVRQVMSAKTKQMADEQNAIWIPKTVAGRRVDVYQKGFTPDELLKYMQSVSGPHWKWKIVRGLADVGVQGHRTGVRQNPSVYQLQPESKQAVCKKVASLQVGDFVTMLQKGAAYSPDKVRAEYRVTAIHRTGPNGSLSLEHPTKLDARKRPLTAYISCTAGDPAVQFGNQQIMPLIGLDVMHLNPSAEELGQIAGKGAHAVGRGLIAGAKALGRFAKSAHAGYTKAQAQRKKAQAESKLGVSDDELQEFMRQKEAEFKAKRAQRQALVNPAKPKKVKLIGK